MVSAGLAKVRDRVCVVGACMCVHAACACGRHAAGIRVVVVGQG